MPFPTDITYKQEPVPINIEYQGKTYTGIGVPVSLTCKEGVCFELDIILNNESLGLLRYDKDHWHMEGVQDQQFIDAIGNEIMLWYE